MKVFLTGYMGVGKSSTGKKLAARLGLPFADLDSIVETLHGKTVQGIFASLGEARFREMEREALLPFLLSAPHPDYPNGFVLATGGGTPCYSDNMDLIVSAGIAVWMKAPAGAIAGRLAKSKQKRPLLQGLSKEELSDFVHKHLALRKPFYAKAQLTFDALNPSAESLALFAERLKSYSR